MDKFAYVAPKNDVFHRVSVTESSKNGLLGSVTRKMGFLEFETQAEAGAALKALQEGKAAVSLGARIPQSNFYEVIDSTPAAV